MGQGDQSRPQRQIFRSVVPDPQPAGARHRRGVLRNACAARGARGDGGPHRRGDRPLERPLHACADSGRDQFPQEDRHQLQPVGQREIGHLEVLPLSARCVTERGGGGFSAAFLLIELENGPARFIFSSFKSMFSVCPETDRFGEPEQSAGRQWPLRHRERYKSRNVSQWQK